MIRLRTLGVLDLRASNGAELRPVLAQPKRLALLAYLAVATPPGFHRRDTLVALFWPELDHEHARGALRKALHGLRHELGEDVVVTRGDDEVGVDPERLWCDAAAFARHVAEGRRGDALELYHGDLLPGLFISDAPEFERWLDRERASLRTEAAAAAWALASAAEAQHEDGAALRAARQAVRLSPDDEGAVRRLIALLDRVGDRAGALHAYEEFARQLAADYEAEPSAETQQLIEAVRQRVDRISGEFDRRAAPAPRDAGGVPERRTSPPTRRRAKRAGLLAGLLILLGLGAIAALLRLRRLRAPVAGGFSDAAEVQFLRQPPAQVPADAPVSPPIQVVLKGAQGNMLQSGSVTLALDSAPWPGVLLLGTVTTNASNGLATFGDVRIDKPGAGYSFVVVSGMARGVSAPFHVGFLSRSVDAFYRHSCVVTSRGQVYCWGNNTLGELGGTAGTLDSVPVHAAAGLDFIQVTGGGDHTCGLTRTGAVYCWGRNDAGQLGNRARAEGPVPVRVAGSGTGKLVFRSVNAGAHHTCGIATGNRIWCWGSNKRGQLGDNSNSNRAAPAATKAPAGLTFIAVTAGGDHSCAITATFHRLFCWGDNDVGELGDGSTTQRLAPVAVHGPNGAQPLAFVAVSAGLHHTCGVTTTRVAYCWGSNSHGQVGDGDTTDRHAPVAVTPRDLGAGLASISAGGAQTCGVTVTGLAYCWGNNGQGELGDGTTVDRHAPALVAGLRGVTWKEVSAGDEHTCGRRVEGSSTRVYCWGSNDLGQLGDGTLNGRTLPAPVVQ